MYANVVFCWRSATRAPRRLLRLATVSFHILSAHAHRLVDVLHQGRPAVEFALGGVFAAVTAVALAVNAGFVYASFVPALLLFLLWTLVTGIVLLRRSPSTQPRIAYST